MDYKINKIKGVGKKTLKNFNNANIYTTNDLLNYSPKFYEIISVKKKLSFNDNKSEVSIKCKVIEEPKLIKTTKVNIVKFKCLLNNKQIDIIAFNQTYLLKAIKKDEIININGKYDYYKNEFILNKVLKFNQKDEYINPLYKIKGIYDANINKIINEILVNEIYNKKDNINEFIFNKYKLINIEKLYKITHFPTSKEDIKQSVKNLKIREAYNFQLDMLNRVDISKDKSSIVIENTLVKEFNEKLPYKLTNDQNDAIFDVISDFNSDKTTSRLIQGDVGSGKTVVALAAIYFALKNNLQIAFMAPTEILAKQHYEFINTYLKQEFKGILLTGSTKNKNKIKKEILNNNINFVVGTHALTTDDLLFNNLGLIIIDEQHKFGVNQRQKLINKGNANLIYLTATPIPRTLALTMFLNTNMSIIKEKPMGRLDVKTISVSINEIDQIINDVKNTLKKNEKVFGVTPSITSTHAKYNVFNVYKAFKKRLNNYKNLYILHGQMDKNEQNKIINNFKKDKHAMLISTSMIEVGIDIKNATLMVIFNANYFGLTQLHQLRGRVGRSNLLSKCYLISEDKFDERLKLLEKTNDGFYLSEQDLKFRGEGNFLGYEQSGINNFRYLNFFKDYKLLEQVKNDIINNK